MLTHPIPRGAAGPMGWWYVFGSASITLLAIQIVTGIGLALVYVPAADKAYESLLYLNYEQPLGWFLRALHYYAGSGMVVMVLAHMTQVFLHGAYKYPRELTWVMGVFLLLCTLGMFFSGQILRWDPDAYWGLAVAGSMAGRVPVLGPAGRPPGPGRAGDRRRLAEPVLRPARLRHPRRAAGLFLALHLWLVLKRGISEPPVPGRPVDPATYDEQYEEELKRGVPFLGEAMLKDAFFSALTVIVVVALAAVARAEGPDRPARPDAGRGEPAARVAVPLAVRPALAQPAGAETFIILVFPVLLIVGPAPGPVRQQPRASGRRAAGRSPCCS